MHRSPTRGQSIEFAEHREYSPGDDVRQIDWKVYARTDRFFVKQFEDETNLIGVLAIDSSESMTYQSHLAPWSKLEYAQSLLLTLAICLLDRRDTTALITFSESIDQALEPSNQMSRWQEMIPILESTPVEKKTHIGRSLSELAAKLHRRSLIFVISDFLDDLDELAQGCKHLRHQRHDVFLLQVLDPAELEFPFRNPTTFSGLEGSGKLTLDPMLLRQQYLKQVEYHQRLLQGLCQQSEIDWGLMTTNQPLSDILPRILHKRNRIRTR